MAADDFIPKRASAVRTWTVHIGGVKKEELRSRLQRAGVLLNEAAATLFPNVRFTTSLSSEPMKAATLSVAELGFPDGATFATIVERANRNGLLLCPLELGRSGHTSGSSSPINRRAPSDSLSHRTALRLAP